MPTFGSLFAGIGGIDLGLERAGWECRWQVEWDGWCQGRLAAHWPTLASYGDITRIDWSRVERVDLLAGGFPCQPVSAAGRQKAQADARWLWPEFLRAVRALRPRLVLVENVTNLLGVNAGSAFGEVLGGLAESGYDTEWDCIPAAAVGAPHERDRVFVVAYPDEWGRLGGDAQPGQRAVPRRDGEGAVAYTDRVGSRRPATLGPSSVAGVRPAQAGPESDGAGNRAADMAHADGGGCQVERQPEHAREPSPSRRQPDGRGSRGRRDGSGVADASGDGRQPWREGDAAQGAQGREPGGGHRGGPLADPDGPRLEGRVFQPERGREWFAGPGGLGESDEPSPDAYATAGGPREATGEPDWRRTEPGLGGGADGLPAGLDGHRWPAPPGPQYDWEPPRTIAGRVPERTQRLKALGNAVVPQVVEVIGRQLLAAIEHAA